MRKSIFFIISLVLILTGCSATVSTPVVAPTITNESTPFYIKQETATPVQTALAQQIQTPTLKPTPMLTPTKNPGNAEIGQKVFYVWKNDTGNIWLNEACEIMNTGDSPVCIDYVCFNLLDGQGNVIETLQTRVSTPNILNKGEKAYAYTSDILDNITDPKEAKKLDIDISFSQTDKIRTLLTVSGTKYYSPKKSNAEPKVTGWIINNSKNVADTINVACGLYDNKGRFLGVIWDMPNGKINPGDKIAFSASLVEMPPSMYKLVNKVICFACDWPS